jgi:hypothetical protein
MNEKGKKRKKKKAKKKKKGTKNGERDSGIGKGSSWMPVDLADPHGPPRTLADPMGPRGSTRTLAHERKRNGNIPSNFVHNMNAVNVRHTFVRPLENLLSAKQSRVHYERSACCQHIYVCVVLFPVNSKQIKNR